MVNKEFFYPSHVLRSVIYFERVYRDNISAAGTAEVEKHWKKEFEKTDEKGSDWYVDYLDAIQCLVKSMLAHIRFDLPRCEAWVFNSYYSKMPGVNIGDFKQDFMSMGGIFDKARKDLKNASDSDIRKWSVNKRT